MESQVAVLRLTGRLGGGGDPESNVWRQPATCNEHLGIQVPMHPPPTSRRCLAGQVKEAPLPFLTRLVQASRHLRRHGQTRSPHLDAQHPGSLTSGPEAFHGTPLERSLGLSRGASSSDNDITGVAGHCCARQFTFSIALVWSGSLPGCQVSLPWFRQAADINVLGSNLQSKLLHSFIFIPLLNKQTKQSTTYQTLFLTTPPTTLPHPVIHASTMSDNNKNAPSTLQSYVDSATGAVQSAIGSLTGNTGDKAQGEVRKDTAQAEHDASHAALKVPGATVSADGGVAKDDANRSEGSWNQTVGSAKEAIGGLIGNEVHLHPPSPLFVSSDPD